MEIIFFISLIFGVLLAIIFTYVSIVSFIEKERRAGLISLILLIIAVPFLSIPFIEFSYQKEFALILNLFIIVIGIVLFTPINFGIDRKHSIPNGKLDERDVMFSRNELKPGSKLYDEYYKRRPEHKLVDDKFREKPGLLDDEALHYQSISFAASEANMEIMDFLKEVPLAEKKQIPKQHNAAEISRYIKNWMKSLGAVGVGVTSLKDYHVYSIKGRGKRYNEEIINTHPLAIAITVEMNDEMMRPAPKGSVIMESAQQYLSVGVLALQLASFIRHLGYDSKAHVDGNYEVVCPLVARDAGLGEIGRMGLLMDKKLGPRIRIAVVTTDMPILIDPAQYDSSAIDFCTICKKCADVCPSKSISFENREMINGVKRWQIDSESCFNFWCSVGTDCGKCMAFCPYSHPDNLMHNFIRWGIRNSTIFRRFALRMDDLFYGRRPYSRNLPDWIDIKVS